MSLKDFIIKIRGSDESVRRRWLIVLSGISMALVIGFWLTYINLIVEPVGSEKSAETEESKEPGFAETFGAGVETVSSQIGASAGNALGFLKKQFGETNTITINKNEMNFILDSLDKVPKTPLP